MADDRIVHIVDDDEAVRQSLAFLLSTNGFAVRAHASATAFLKEARRMGRASLLTDLRMPDMTGVELLHRLRKAHVQMPAIVITGHGDVPMAVEAMKAGASDFIEKPFENAVLIEALGRLSATPEKTSEEPEEAERRLAHLSAREREVFREVAAGKPNKTIAHELSISPRTVEVHRANVMAKTGARNLAELVRLAMLAGESAPEEENTLIQNKEHSTSKG